MTERPRVLLVGQGPPVTGGIPSFIESLLKDPVLRDRVHLEHLNTSPRGEKRPGALTASNTRQVLDDARRVGDRARGADVVHLNLAAAPGLPLARAIVLARSARRAGAAVILHAHTGRLDLSARRASYRVLLRQAGRSVDALVVVSGAAEAAARPLVPRVVRLENGIEASAYPDGPKHEPAQVAFVGTVCERKGLIDLRDALAGLPGTPAVILGDGRQEGPGVFERVRAAYQEAGLEGVTFTGSVGHPEVVRRLAAASIFCLPSHWEGFPLSLLEAMAAGCAVVASRVGDVPEMLDHGRAGILVEPRDPLGLRAALRRLLDDDDERRRLGRAARERAETTYPSDRVARGLAGLYEELAPR
jgi:glycosyltransferase involved in cell wall biosynthesis